MHIQVIQYPSTAMSPSTALGVVIQDSENSIISGNSGITELSFILLLETRSPSSRGTSE